MRCATPHRAGGACPGCAAGSGARVGAALLLLGLAAPAGAAPEDGVRPAVPAAAVYGPPPTPPGPPIAVFPPTLEIAGTEAGLWIDGADPSDQDRAFLEEIRPAAAGVLACYGVGPGTMGGMRGRVRIEVRGGRIGEVLFLRTDAPETPGSVASVCAGTRLLDAARARARANPPPGGPAPASTLPDGVWIRDLKLGYVDREFPSDF